MEKPRKRLELLDLPDAVRELVSECELTGRQTIFERNGRPVAILVSHDEYVALHETIEIAGDTDLRARITAADEQANRGAVLLPEDLFGE
jgi:PHD/YefM family antitoxin component YafN of YafNO toxin-antitoxin module